MPPCTDTDIARTASDRTRRRGLCALAVLACAVPLLLLNLRCSEDSGVTPGPNDQLHALAGGGRTSGEDPFIGGPWDSGPGETVPGGPGIDPSGAYRPLVMLQAACGEAPAHLVIEDSTAWRQWWDANVACGGRLITGQDGATLADSGGIPPDSGDGDPDSTDPEPWFRPEVDFTQYVVIAITLERAQGEPRQLVIDGIIPGDLGTTVKYTIYRPAEDCDGYWGDSLTVETAPAIAVQVPRPVTPPITWGPPRDTTYSCRWEPDPDEPVTLYYTDAECGLGPGQQILSNQDDFDAWIAQALACDLERWGSPDSTYPPSDSGWTPEGRWGDPSVAPGFTIPIDFTQFAVIVLRAGNQDRWGGGIWLTGFATSATGTRIEYTVIEPGEDCPLIAETEYVDWDLVNPSVAIRVPLPLPAPVTWERSVNTIDCRWGPAGDSTIVVGSDSVKTR